MSLVSGGEVPRHRARTARVPRAAAAGPRPGEGRGPPGEAARGAAHRAAALRGGARGRRRGAVRGGVRPALPPLRVHLQHPAAQVAGGADRPVFGGGAHGQESVPPDDHGRRQDHGGGAAARTHPRRRQAPRVP
eukprot:8284248-Pyramimonas_sp.AAC.1